jgi:hypothetical protein
MHRTTRLVTGLMSVTLAFGGAVAAAPGSAAAVTQPIDCPTALPTKDAVKDVQGTGFTVESGTKPDPFSATVLGRLTDGILPGTDLIIARVSSPALSRAHGVWAGMSGSPVYTDDGRLIGSVSYTLGVNTDIAGITPAQALLPVLGGVSAPARSGAAKGRSHIAVTKSQARALVAAGVPAAQADAGFSRIKLPVSVSGKATKQMLDAVKRIPDIRLVSSSAKVSGAAAAIDQISAGSNFVAALSYGDVSFYGWGTTTVVCKGKAVAFGHPFFDAGATRMTAHGADAVYVQPDSLFGAFKLVNPGGVVGVVDTDMNTGIRAVLGAKPATTLITSSFRRAGKPAVTGSTTGVYEEWLDIIAANHAYIEAIKTLGYEGRGTGRMTVVIKGVRAKGKAFSLTRQDAFSSTFDLPFELGDNLFALVTTLEGQTFEQIHITSISITGTLDPTYRRYTVSKAEAKQGSKWVRLDGSHLTARAGGSLALRATLHPFKGIGADVVVPLTVAVPKKAKGVSTQAALETGAGSLFSNAGTFDKLLSELAGAARAEAVRARLGSSSKPLSTTSVRIGAPIDPAQFGGSVKVS